MNQKELNYTDFKDNLKVMVFIPATGMFHNAEIIETVDKDFTIAFTKPIKGHYDIIHRITNQNQLDKWFLIKKRQKVTEELIKEGQEKYSKNGKFWIFSGTIGLMQKVI